MVVTLYNDSGTALLPVELPPKIVARARFLARREGKSLEEWMSDNPAGRLAELYRPRTEDECNVFVQHVQASKEWIGAIAGKDKT